tara:strand:- start:104 stop:691 length:588 start_codon:yes stop_codon:yes gene_type:complete
MDFFITLDNTYTDNELQSIFAELNFLQFSGNFLDPSETGSARIEDTDKNLKYKNNKGVFLDSIYSDRNTSVILKLNRKLFDINIDFVNLPPIFKLYQSVKHDTTLVSYYEDGGSYFSHRDIAHYTAVTYLYKTPKKFTGGNLILHDHNATLEPVFNRTYIFPSYVDHEVTPIEMSKEHANLGFGRYCISNFMIAT